MATQIRPSIQLLLATCLMFGLWKLSGNVRSKFESLPINKPSSVDTQINVNAKLYPVFVESTRLAKKTVDAFAADEVINESQFSAGLPTEKQAVQQPAQSPEFVFAQSIAPKLRIDGFSNSGVFISGSFLSLNEELPISIGSQGQPKFKVLSIVNGQSVVIGFGAIRITLFANGTQKIDDPIAKKAEEAQRQAKENELKQPEPISSAEAVLTEPQQIINKSAPASIR